MTGRLFFDGCVRFSSPYGTGEITGHGDTLRISVSHLRVLKHLSQSAGNRSNENESFEAMRRRLPPVKLEVFVGRDLCAESWTHWNESDAPHTIAGFSFRVYYRRLSASQFKSAFRSDEAYLGPPE